VAAMTDKPQNACAVTRYRTDQLRWIDDPWSALTTGEADAWRAGFEAAKAQAVRICRQTAIPDYCTAPEAHGRMAGTVEAAHAIAAMEPPA
jgi:hypothetical protein